MAQMMLYLAFILAPCFSGTMAYFYFSFYHHKNELYFIKRGEILVKIEYILLISKVAFEVPFLMTNLYTSILDAIDLSVRSTIVIAFLSFCGLQNIIMIRIAYFYVQSTRVHVATETIRFSNSSININNSKLTCVCQNNNKKNDKQSKEELEKNNNRQLSQKSDTNDKKENNSHLNSVGNRMWYIINQFGSTSRLTILFFMVCLFDFACAIVSSFIIFANDEFTAVMFIRGLWFSKALISAIIILVAAKHKIFQFTDSWYVSKEFIITGKLWLGHAIVTLFGVVMFVLIEFVANVPSMQLIPIYAALHWLFMVLERSYICTVWVVRKNIGNNQNSTTDGVKSRPISAKISVNASHRISKHVIFDSAMLNVTSSNGQKEKDADIIDHDIDKKYKSIKLTDLWYNGSKDIHLNNTAPEIFSQFWDHCARELSIENVVFWIETIQIMQFLIEHEYIDKNEAHPLNVELSTQHLKLKNTPIMANLNNNYNNNLYNNNNSNVKNYEVIRIYFCQLYKEYIQSEIAPYELNISHEMRNSFTQYYELVASKEQPMTKEFFNKNIWPIIKEAATETYMLMWYSFNRFCNKL